MITTFLNNLILMLQSTNAKFYYKITHRLPNSYWIKSNSSYRHLQGERHRFWSCPDSYIYPTFLLKWNTFYFSHAFQSPCFCSYCIIPLECELMPNYENSRLLSMSISNATSSSNSNGESLLLSHTTIRNMA